MSKKECEDFLKVFHENDVIINPFTKRKIFCSQTKKRILKQCQEVLNTSEDYTQHNVRGDGSCFYRSIYNFLNDFDLKDEFNNCVFKDKNYSKKYEKWLKSEKPSKENEENFFVNIIRRTLRDRILKNEDYNITMETYNYLSDVYHKYGIDNYKEVVKNNMDWMGSKKHIKTFPTFESFKEKLANRIRTLDYWATELEVEIIKEILNNCSNLKIHIFIDKVPKNYKYRHNTIYLLNIDGIHYNYIVPNSIS